MGVDAYILMETSLDQSQVQQVCDDYTDAIGGSRLHGGITEDKGSPKGLEQITRNNFEAQFQYVPSPHALLSNSLYLQENSLAYTRLYWPRYERGPWANVALAVGWLYDRLPQVQIYYANDHGDHSVLHRDNMKAVTRHWALWGHKPYRSSGVGYDYGDYDAHDTPDDYPWYSVAYHIGRRIDLCHVGDWDLMPDPEQLEDHEKVVAEILDQSAVDEHREAVARAMGTNKTP